MWAITLSVALFISADPWYAAALVASAYLVVRTHRGDEPWSRSFNVAIKFILVIIAIRMLIAVLIGVPIPGTTLFTIPTLELPEWIAGIRIGGAVTSERLLTTLGEVMIIVGVVALFAAATSLASPHRSIRALPLAFYQLGLILTISTSIFPQLVASIKRIRMARRLRGQAPKGLRHWRKIAMPLLEDALERSLDLAAAMESRGFGQRIRRSTYRPDTWGGFESLILISAGLSAIGALIFQGSILNLLVAGLVSALLIAWPNRSARNASLNK